MEAIKAVIDQRKQRQAKCPHKHTTLMSCAKTNVLLWRECEVCGKILAPDWGEK
jgi:ribosomal protein S27E